MCLPSACRSFAQKLALSYRRPFFSARNRCRALLPTSAFRRKHFFNVRPVCPCVWYGVSASCPCIVGVQTCCVWCSSFSLMYVLTYVQVVTRAAYMLFYASKFFFVKNVLLCGRANLLLYVLVCSRAGGHSRRVHALLCSERPEAGRCSAGTPSRAGTQAWCSFGHRVFMNYVAR